MCKIRDIITEQLGVAGEGGGAKWIMGRVGAGVKMDSGKNIITEN